MSVIDAFKHLKSRKITGRCLGNLHEYPLTPDQAFHVSHYLPLNYLVKKTDN